MVREIQEIVLRIFILGEWENGKTLKKGRRDAKFSRR